MAKSLEEIECDLRRELYAQQVARRDSVRSTIAVPLAILGFAAFGFNGLTLTAYLDWSHPALQFLSFAALAMTAFAVFFFLWALSTATRLRYNPRNPLPEVFDLAEQEKEILDDLRHIYRDPAELQSRGRAGTWEAVNAEYGARTAELERISSQNLDVQEEMLNRLLFGLGCLILSIVLYQSVRLLAEHYFT